MDDDPVGGGDCDLDVLFTTRWETPSQGITKAYSVAEKKDTTLPELFGDDDRNTSWQYQLNASSCVFTSAIHEGTCKQDGFTIGEKACDAPQLSPDKRTATKKHGIKRDYSSGEGINSSSKFTLVECTANAHCQVGGNSDANASTAKCNVDADSNGVGDITSNFNPNTCIDSAPPGPLFLWNLDRLSFTLLQSMQRSFL